MILLTHFDTAADMSKLHSVLEHLSPDIEIMYVAHYEVDDMPAQEVFIGLPWGSVQSALTTSMLVADSGLDIVVIYATIIGFETSY